MTEMLFRLDPYQREGGACVKAVTDEGGIVLDASVFYPKGGGQPGDSGHVIWDGNSLPVASAVKGVGDDIVLIPAQPGDLPPVGAEVQQVLDWDRRYRHMRIHTALHLLSVAIPFGVTGGQISTGYGRLDFDMPDTPEDRDGIEQALNNYVSMDLRISDGWITEAELDAAPELVKTMAVKPPRGAGDIRLIRIGDEDNWIDLQPCGGTHVARTGEIGALRLGKVQKKGRLNRRVYVHLDD